MKTGDNKTKLRPSEISSYRAGAKGHRFESLNEKYSAWKCFTVVLTADWTRKTENGMFAFSLLFFILIVEAIQAKMLPHRVVSWFLFSISLLLSSFILILKQKRKRSETKANSADASRWILKTNEKKKIVEQIDIFVCSFRHSSALIETCAHIAWPNKCEETRKIHLFKLHSLTGSCKRQNVNTLMLFCVHVNHLIFVRSNERIHRRSTQTRIKTHKTYCSSALWVVGFPRLFFFTFCTFHEKKRRNRKREKKHFAWEITHIHSSTKDSKNTRKHTLALLFAHSSVRTFSSTSSHAYIFPYVRIICFQFHSFYVFFSFYSLKIIIISLLLAKHPSFKPFKSKKGFS